MNRKIRMDSRYTLAEGTARFRDLLDTYAQMYKDTKMSDEDASELGRDVRDLSRILQARTDYWEQRRGMYLQIALGMIAFSIAMGTAIAAVYSGLMMHPVTFIVMVAVIAMSSTALVAGIKVLAIWNRQNNPDYPFTKGYMHWRWQYRYAEETSPEFRYRYESREEYEADIETYIKNMHAYAKKTLDLTPMEILEQDISQAFLLIENEKYKIKFVSELRDGVKRWSHLVLWVGAASALVCTALVVFGLYCSIS